jgi:glycosyltransferase involved in cell wall biosynthesis
LLEAVRLLNRDDVELVIMGSLLAPMEFYRKQGIEFVYEPPRPHHAVLQLMKTCDVLVLPSIVEGRALVQQEAMACGLPIIVTPNAGGEDLVLEGETGFLVPIRNPESITSKLAWLADHRDDLAAMRDVCREKAAQYSWGRYARLILRALNSYKLGENLQSLAPLIS